MISILTEKMNPLNSAELEALKIANEVSIFLNSLSTVDSGNAIINITNPMDIRINHIGFFDSQRLTNFFNELRIYELREGFDKAFTKKGHYIIVTPYRGDKQRPFETALILSYPKERDDSLEISISQPKSLCIVKEKGKERAEVKECDE